MEGNNSREFAMKLLHAPTAASIVSVSVDAALIKLKACNTGVFLTFARDSDYGSIKLTDALKFRDFLSKKARIKIALFRPITPNAKRYDVF